MDNILTTIQWDIASGNEEQIQENNQNGSASQDQSSDFISFETGEQAAESVLWIFMILFGLAGMVSSDNPIRGFLFGAIAGGIIGSIFGPVVGGAIEFGKSLPQIFP